MRVCEIFRPLLKFRKQRWVQQPFLGGLSLHLNHLITSGVGICYRQFGTLRIGIFLSNLDSRQLETSLMTYYGHFWHVLTFGDSRAIWVDFIFNLLSTDKLEGMDPERGRPKLIRPFNCYLATTKFLDNSCWPFLGVRNICAYFYNVELFDISLQSFPSKFSQGGQHTLDVWNFGRITAIVVWLQCWSVHQKLVKVLIKFCSSLR